MTPGEAARMELDRAFPDLKKVGWLGPQVKLFSRQIPLYYAGPYKGELYYVDLSGAYWQVYRCLQLDVKYPCGRGVCSLTPVGEALKEWKQARNSVIGVCRSRSATGVKGRRVYQLATTNRYLAPELWATVCGILQFLATFAIRTCHAQYVNTDGYIFHSESGFDIFTAALRSWGIAFKTERGPGEIRGWGNYEVGGKRAGRRSEVGAQCAAFDNLEAPFPGLFDWWLRQKERIE